MAEKEETLKLAQQAFKRLRKRARQLDIDSKHFRNIKSLNNLKNHRYRWSIVFLLCLSVVALPFIGYRGFMALGDESQTKLMKLLADKVMGIDIDTDTCLLPTIELYQDMFRPPVDCGVCEDVETVDIVNNLKKEEFLEKYAYTGRPVIIRNGDVFNMSDRMARMQGDPWYIGWSNCDSRAANVLRKYYRKPYFLPDDSESSKTDWIFMGCPGYGASLHIDAVDKPSWQAQIKGTKQWILEPPPECYFKCKTAKHVVTVHPGDIIVLDTNRWFHQTDIIGQDMSITIGSEYD